MNGDAEPAALRLQMRELAVERGGRVLASGLSCALGPGEALIVAGPNGAGKSTLLQVVAGLLGAAAGTVALEGGGERWPDIGSASHFLSPANAMKAALTVRENLDFWQRFGGKAGRTIEEALVAVELPQTIDMPFGWLSTGQKRRIAIARLLLNYRPLWILDEPTSGLDTAAVDRFAALMQDHRRTGGMVLAATHLPLGLEGAQRLEIGGGP